MMRQEFLKEVNQKAYFKDHQKVLLALSGGLDSMTLLDLLYTYRDKLGIELFLAHVNHKQREVSDFEEQELKKIAQKLGVKIFTSSFYGQFSEKKARDFRYVFFKKIMQEEGCTALVTAHHADDQAETIFMRILRGSRLSHLSSIKERQVFATGELIRPLLSFKKSDFPAIFHFEDETNQENNYLRNRVRNNYFPILEKENPRFQQQLLELGKEVEQLQSAMAYLTKDMPLTDVTYFQEQPAALQNYLLQAYLEKFPDLQLTRQQFAEVLHILQTKANYCQPLKAGYELFKDYQDFEIRKISLGSDLKEKSILLKWNNLVDYSNYRFSFGKELVGENVVSLAVSRETDICLRHRKAGDKILLNGHYKKIRRLFIDKKVPAKAREEAIILEQNDEILLIVNLATSDLSKYAKSDIMDSKLYIQKLE